MINRICENLKMLWFIVFFTRTEIRIIFRPSKTKNKKKYEKHFSEIKFMCCLSISLSQLKYVFFFWNEKIIITFNRNWSNFTVYLFIIFFFSIKSCHISNKLHSQYKIEAQKIKIRWKLQHRNQLNQISSHGWNRYISCSNRNRPFHFKYVRKKINNV